ncbi:MAG: ATP-dependent 6-phosphofructokinase [Chloroflexi bacterium]|nr:ATP-dependent 6-phosphofructokinase [Chloroflexota bacterium]
MAKKNRIGILTGGGDCPGINAVIRAITKKAIIDHGCEIIGIEDGFEGVIHNRCRKLSYDDVSGIINLGGTILGASNVSNPYRYAVTRNGGVEFVDMSPRVIANVKELALDCLMCIGGDGTLSIASRLACDGVPVIGLPKTIDNDLKETDITFGFDSAVCIATEGIDRVHTTAQSHHRIMVVEVMGRQAGWIALHAGVAGGGDIILIPEIPYDISVVADKITERNQKGKRFTIVVVAEGARPQGGEVVIQRIVKESTEPVRLGGIGFVLGSQIEQATGIETRTVVMGHLLRGGGPTPFDRVLATRLGVTAVDMLFRGQLGQMAAVKGPAIEGVPLDEVARGPRTVPRNDPLIAAARSVGTCFGDRMVCAPG